MITQEEIQFIYDNWKINQYLVPDCWGKSYNNARPEYYLALLRGAVFTYRNKEIFFSHINKNINSKNYNSDFEFIEKLCFQWIQFLGYISSKKYRDSIIFYKKDLKERIIQTLQKHISTDERIYIL